VAEEEHATGTGYRSRSRDRVKTRKKSKMEQKRTDARGWLGAFLLGVISTEQKPNKNGGLVTVF